MKSERVNFVITRMEARAVEGVLVDRVEAVPCKILALLVSNFVPIRKRGGRLSGRAT